MNRSDHRLSHSRRRPACPVAQGFERHGAWFARRRFRAACFSWRIGSGRRRRCAGPSNVSATLRGVAMWLAIILVLVAGYQYRYELQDVASRVTAGLIPGSPLSITDADGRATVMMEKRPSGHFEVRGSVQGAPIDFLVDTGATSTVLTAEEPAAQASTSTRSLSPFRFRRPTARRAQHAREPARSPSAILSAATRPSWSRKTARSTRACSA